MTELKHTPQGKLASYVKFFWYSDGYSSPASKERVLPAGSSQIIINLENNHFRHFDAANQSAVREYPHTIITGINSKCIFLDPSCRTSTINVVLRPGGIQALFGLPANELHNHVISPEDVTGADGCRSVIVCYKPIIPRRNL